MLTDSEITALMQDDKVLLAIKALKGDFVKNGSEFSGLGDNDFVSLVLMTPAIGVALANGSISLFEELTLNKKARFLSRGSYFMKKDPVVQGMKYLIGHFDLWEERCYKIVQLLIHTTLKKSKSIYELLQRPEASSGNTTQDILNAPYIFVKFLSFLFLEEEDDMLSIRAISRVEFEKVKFIGQKLQIAHFPVFQSFCDLFELRD